MTKEIKGFPGYYVSDDGTVTGPRGEIGWDTTDGYRMVSLPLGNCKYKSVLVHRLVAEAFVPGRTEKRNVVDHIDGDKTNNNAHNLRWTTSRENVLLAYTEQGRFPERQRPISVILHKIGTEEYFYYNSIHSASVDLGLSYWHLNHALHRQGRRTVKGYAIYRAKGQQS